MERAVLGETLGRRRGRIECVVGTAGSGDALEFRRCRAFRRQARGIRLEDHPHLDNPADVKWLKRGDDVRLVPLDLDQADCGQPLQRLPDRCPANLERLHQMCFRKALAGGELERGDLFEESLKGLVAL